MPDIGQPPEMSDAAYASATADAEARRYATFLAHVYGHTDLVGPAGYRPTIYSWQGWIDIDPQYMEYRCANDPSPLPNPVDLLLGRSRTALRRFIWAKNNDAAARTIFVRPGIENNSTQAIAIPAGATVKIGPSILYAAGFEMGISFDNAVNVQARVTAESYGDVAGQMPGANLPYVFV